MAWQVESVMDQRLCFIAACLRADEPISSLCLRFEISRKTGYKWLSRYRDFGAAGVQTGYVGNTLGSFTQRYVKRHGLVPPFRHDSGVHGYDPGRNIGRRQSSRS
jgi:Helix-turn-helix domain